MKYKLLTATLLAASCFAQAQAATIYTNRAAFLAATSGQVIDDFEENASGSFTSYGSTYAGTTFTVNGTNIFTVDPDFDPFYQWGTGDVLDFESSPGTITVNAGITALGFDFGNPANFQGAGFVTINGVNYNLLGQPNFNFWGIVDTNPIGTISWNGGLGIMDNVTTGFGAVVPEPSTWALLILGFGAVGAGMRRRKVSLAYA